MNINFDPSSRQPKGPVAQILTLIVGVIVLGLSLMFSLVVFAVIAVVGLILWLYFMWRTREVRKQMRDQFEAQMKAPTPDAQSRETAVTGDVIEGEAVRLEDEPPPK